KLEYLILNHLSALSLLKQAAEQRVGIESGDAQPRHAAVPADQRSGRPVPDQSEILQRKVTGEPPDRTESRVELEHVVTPRAQRTYAAARGITPLGPAPPDLR